MSIEGLINQQEKPAYVSFVREAVEDKPASVREGRFVARDVDYVHITPAYTKDIIIREVADWFPKLELDVRNERIPQSWVEHYRKQYQAWLNGQELPLDGTPIKGWGVLSPAQQEMLIRRNIRTVEDLSVIPEDAMRGIGMGSLDMKNKAKAWVAQLKDKGPITQEMAALRAENASLAGQVETLQKQVAALMAVKETPETSITAADLIEPGHEALVEAYKQKFGKAPHHLMKDATIAERLK